MLRVRSRGCRLSRHGLSVILEMLQVDRRNDNCSSPVRKSKKKKKKKKEKTGMGVWDNLKLSQFLYLCSSQSLFQ